MTKDDANAPPTGDQAQGVSPRRAKAIARRKARRRGQAAPEANPAIALREEALAEHARADYTGALRRWAELRRLSPGSEEGFAGAIQTAKAAGRDQLADSLAREGAAAIPAKADALRAKADAPSWEAADAPWHAAMQAPPGDRRQELAAALAPLKLASAGRPRFAIVLARIKIIEERFPNYAKAYVAHLSMLRRLNDLDTAARLAAEFCAKFPDDERLGLSHAAILDARKDFAGALALVSALRARLERSAEIEAAMIQALSRQGRLDEADDACTQAVAAFPGSAELMLEYGALATRRGDWTEALRRWQQAEALFPGNPRIRKGAAAAQLHLADTQIPDTAFLTDEASQIFARFESLGGSYGGCEFGITQRKFGSTALGLLRYSNVRIEALIEGMTSGFEGMGDLAQTQLKTYKLSADREEYIVWDTKYGLDSHTFIETKNAPADKMLVQTAKRLAFLRGRLLEELGKARKIFVYKFRDAAPDASLHKVFEAVRTQGPATMLCILKANDANPKGSLRKLRDGLYAGYLGHFMAEGPVGESNFIDFPAWKDLCARMLAEHESAQAAPILETTI